MKGFTLIELLAVLIILAIILLIAYPLISNVIAGVKRDAFESSVKLIVKAAEQDYMKRNLAGDNREVEYKFDDSVQTVTPADVPVLDVNGTLPKDGIITVYPDGGVEAKVSDGEFYTDTNGNGQVNEPVVYVPETHDPLLAGSGPATPWIFEVTIPSGGDTFSFGVKDANLTINWGDGAETTHSYVGPDFITHDYEEGVYNVTVTGTTSHVTFCTFDFENQWWCDNGTAGYLTDILTPIPASMGLTSANAMFAFVEVPGFTSLNFFDEAIKNITDISYMFAFAYYFNQPIENWDTSNVTNMKYLFCAADDFNQPLNNWDTSNVTNMYGVFDSTLSFNQPLDKWNTSKVTTMREMFRLTNSFNQPLITWDTSNVTDMQGMFTVALKFNGSVAGWNVSKVTDMTKMFENALEFNQPLNTWITSSLTKMDNIFYKAKAFNHSVDSWDVSGVTSMYQVFREATVFNQPLNSWDVSSVTNTSGMFLSATAFNQPLNNWSTSNISSANGMFQNASSFNQNLSSWCVSKFAVSPPSFSTGATSWTLPKPIWGTCP